MCLGQPKLERAGGRRHQPGDVTALEPDRVAVQVVPDDLQLAAGGVKVSVSQLSPGWRTAGASPWPTLRS